MRHKIQLVAALVATALLAPQAASAYTVELELHNSQYVERGREYLKKGNIRQAIEQYEMGLKGGLGRSDLQDAHNDLCVAYYFLAEYETALEHCHEAIKLVPNHWIHYNNRANIYLMQGELALAQRDYKKALRLHPKSDVIEKNIALAERMEKARSLGSEPTNTVTKNKDAKDPRPGREKPEYAGAK